MDFYLLLPFHQPNLVCYEDQLCLINRFARQNWCAYEGRFQPKFGLEPRFKADTHIFEAPHNIGQDPRQYCRHSTPILSDFTIYSFPIIWGVPYVMA